MATARLLDCVDSNVKLDPIASLIETFELLTIHLPSNAQLFVDCIEMAKRMLNFVNATDSPY